MNKTAMAIGVVGIAAGLLLYATKAKASPSNWVEVELKEGWNEIIYVGKAQSGKTLLASIKDSLVGAYMLFPQTTGWVAIDENTVVTTNIVIAINVNKDCTWTYYN